MTKFSSLEKPRKVTSLTHVIDNNLVINETENYILVSHYENCLWLGYNSQCNKDVFKLWNDDKPNDFLIAFGVKGSEFDEAN